MAGFHLLIGLGVLVLLSLSTENELLMEQEKFLDDINEISSGSWGSLCSSEHYRSVAVPVKVDFFESARQKAEMVYNILHDFGQLNNQVILELLIKNLIKSDRTMETCRIMTFTKNTSHRNISLVFTAYVKQPDSPMKEHVVVPGLEDQLSLPAVVSRQSTAISKLSQIRSNYLTNLPWVADPFGMNKEKSNKFMSNVSNITFKGWWTYPYFWCPTRKWQMTYSIPLQFNPNPEDKDRLDALLSFDVSVSNIDLNQCNVSVAEVSSPASVKGDHILSYFNNSHKCHNETSTCRFESGRGWNRGSYSCICRPGYYPLLKNVTAFNGTLVELAYKDKKSFNSTLYDTLYQCLRCADGCDECVDDSPCLAPYDWSFRIVLLTISMACIVVTGILMGAVYKYRRLKVFKVASPIFLCITLLGCAIMYAEMAAIFPVLNTPSCVATKWTRHMGFCLTYSSLLMKTWRVSLTYRVKSAHKLKLTDQQLLQWMFPILLVMVVYLGAWTASAPPKGEEIPTGTMKFTQCTYNWWDHSLAIGEMIFLIWGIQVCYSVRHAETYFNETKHISWAVYNIALVNLIMVSIHIYILPNVGPDMKYFFGLIRTQLGTTVTIALVFGPKFYLVAKGQGDQHDNRARARGVTASFSLNGISVTNEEPLDLNRENEELKEELQKLAGQMEFMKIVHMGINNPHLKPKPGGYFSMSSMTCSPSGPPLNQSIQHCATNNNVNNSLVVDPISTPVVHFVDEQPKQCSTPSKEGAGLVHSPSDEPLPDDSLTAELLGERV